MFKQRGVAVMIGMVLSLGMDSVIADDKPARINVQFIVTTPEIGGKGAPRIYAGTSLDGWTANGRSLDRVAEHVYAATWAFPPGHVIHYKFTRDGSWATVERDANGRDTPNRILLVEDGADDVVVFHHVLSWADKKPVRKKKAMHSRIPEQTGTKRTATRRKTLTGDIRFHRDVDSSPLKRSRDIVVYLPPSYEQKKDKRYPVLYMHDGNNLFDEATSFLGVEWGVDEAAEKLIKAGRIEEIIVVGMYNTPDRVSEYTPFPDERRGGGDGDKYLEYVVKKLKPFIDTTYRTKPGRAHTGIAGSSLGGLISLYAICKYPETFRIAGVISPSLIWADGRIMELVKKTEFKPDTRMWIEIGITDALPPDSGEKVGPVVPLTRELVSELKSRNLKEGAGYRYEELPGRHHDEGAWSQRVEDILLYFYGTGL